MYVNKSNPRTKRFVECILNYRYPKKPENIIEQSNEKPLHDEFSHALRAFEYYCWNLSIGGIGGIHYKQQGAIERRSPIYYQGQIALDPAKFANAGVKRSRIGGLH